MKMKMKMNIGVCQNTPQRDGVYPIPKKRRAQKFIRAHQNQDRIFTVQFETPAKGHPTEGKQCFQLLVSFA